MDSKAILEKIELQKAFQAQKSMLNYKKRKEILKKLYKNIQVMTPEINKALKQDLNKGEVESYMTEIGLVLTEISYMLKNIKRLTANKRVHTPMAEFPAKSYKMPCPYGVVLIISPWNYPFMLTLEPLVDAIAAGNSVVVKPSEYSPNVSAVIEKLIEITFEPGHVTTVQGAVEECSFLLEQDLDYIFYTGSTRVGKIVMQKAAEHFTPVTLELGGKSPCIVDETANIKLAAKRIVFGKLLNCGQTCVAPDYLYCAESVKKQLVDEISRQIILQYGIDPIHNSEYPRMVNLKQFEAMKKYINKDKILFGGKADEQLLKIEPTILDATFDDEVMQEEIFGPILPVVTFKTIDEAIERVNKFNKPLALYIFSNKKENQQKVLNNCDFGGGCVNETIMHIASNVLPFGGLKQSGIGSYHGEDGFNTFTHFKSIVHKANWIDLPMRYQPFNKLKLWLIKMFLK